MLKHPKFPSCQSHRGTKHLELDRLATYRSPNIQLPLVMLMKSNRWKENEPLRNILSAGASIIAGARVALNSEPSVSTSTAFYLKSAFFLRLSDLSSSLVTFAQTRLLQKRECWLQGPRSRRDGG